MTALQEPNLRDADAFFFRHPVFTFEDFDRFLRRRGGGATPHPDARKTLLRYYLTRGRVVRVRRGLYASVPPGESPRAYPVDPFLIAGRLTGDAVLAYHTALALHGVAHSLREERLCLTRQEPPRPFRFQGVTYRAVSPPDALPPGEALTFEVETQDRQGMTLRVTTLERTLVDALDRPALAGGWEEAWRSLEGVEAYLHADRVVRYTLLLDNATTAAKVGYFLQTNRERLRVGDRYLAALRARVPKQPHYVERDRRRDARLVREWNLMIPTVLSPCEGGDPVGDIPV